MTSRRTWVEQIMGLPVSVLARGEGAGSSGADTAVREVFAEMVEVDRAFSPFRDASAVSLLARGEVSWDRVDPVVREVADRCVAARELTGGLFDADVPRGRWDPSGLVKGWAVERAGERLRKISDVDWCLNAGGDVLVVCPSGAPFMVGIQDPRDPSGVAAVLPRTGGSVATSGTAARGAHLYDPRTGRAVRTRWMSVSVSGPSLEYADVLATAAFVAADDWPRVVGSLPGYEGLGILADGNLFATSGWSVG
ncbi:FAD:protein FMN transferase [Kribbella sindirgiensis]|uniref:FAD:protein FMN transferase n=1 Tax=Kribbella sindirgiensis TaxID=1124744 RepID=A0A4R0I1G1_9ACTN|nr:FAD:protein FMN transferase [Kribbella sindirgiensis]TCC21555.1 FAD:protein FMN transferase [Kribbella sindirgiensis]